MASKYIVGPMGVPSATLLILCLIDGINEPDHPCSDLCVDKMLHIAPLLLIQK